MDVNEHERLSNIILKHKLKEMNTRDYPTLPLDTNQSKGTVLLFPMIVVKMISWYKVLHREEFEDTEVR
jgi:hypothetical protein